MKELTKVFLEEIERQIDKETKQSSPNIWEMCQTANGRDGVIEAVANMALDKGLAPSECIIDIEMIMNGE